METRITSNGILRHALYKYCPALPHKPLHTTHAAVYELARTLHEAAMHYATIWDFMTLLFRERVLGERDTDGTIRLHSVDRLPVAISVADMLIGAPTSPELQQQLSATLTEFDLAECLREIRVQPLGAGRIKYFTPRPTFERMAAYVRHSNASLWEFDASWNLGNYTIAEFREFWRVLATLCLIHHCVCFFSGVSGGALESVVRILQKKRWINEITRWSALTQETVAVILDDLSYDPTLYARGKKQPDVRYQPFFLLDAHILALSTSLVLHANALRNIWDLVSIKRATLHADLRNKKEQWWLAQLTPQLEAYGLQVYSAIHFRYQGRQSDLDLLVLDRHHHFGIGCQLKWLTDPDAVKDIQYIDDELQKGIEQAELSLQWLRTETERLQHVTGISPNELHMYEFQALVLSKNSIGSGWAYKLGIPIINERLLHWILGEPHRKSLQALWRVGEERRYLPKRQKHFTVEDMTVEFAGMRFLGEQIGVSLQQPWDPAVDIDLTALY